ncbi:hypothetical protein K7X08_016084 [Anisodus acutangulus]|uniref:Uncharacterized protein n=1 Tax=Anisodus acutangulus TaxID=402998 RepID=A0A9Q1QYV4_9SOLA|nr:hypothetical protein K7X08_016084 [Anisodus acutangulus]
MTAEIPIGCEPMVELLTSSMKKWYKLTNKTEDHNWLYEDFSDTIYGKICTLISIFGSYFDWKIISSQI